MAFGTAACRARHLCTNGSYVVALAAANGSGRDKLAAAVRLKKGFGNVEVLTADLRALQRLEGVVATDLAFWEDTVVFSSSDGSVKLWDLRTKAPQRSLMDVSNDPALSVTLTNGVCACARGTSILMADVSSGQIMADFADVHSERVSCVRFRPGVASSDLVSAGDDGLLCVLDTQRHPGEDEALRIAMNSEESVERLAFAADGQMLCSISTTDVMHLWSLSEPKEGILCARLDPMRNDQHLQVGESDGHVVDIFYDQPSGCAYALGSSVRGKLCLYHLNLEGTNYISDLQAGSSGHNGLVRVALDLQHGRFVTGGEDGKVCLWGGTGGSAQPNTKRQRT
ncbi:WD repeat-containing protein 89 homolog [Durusdinium trenchii]|uniref:WD repeat-containing protein 89 homolog n=1 Tax=Durusdinium trenchii TaxID=1381693 RepID=A0ABP0Q991_9DINO